MREECKLDWSQSKVPVGFSLVSCRAGVELAHERAKSSIHITFCIVLFVAV